MQFFLPHLIRSRSCNAGREAGALPDIHVFSVPKRTWEHSSAAIIQVLRQADGVLKVDVQEPRARAKRGKLDGPLPWHIMLKITHQDIHDF